MDYRITNSSELNATNASHLRTWHGSITRNEFLAGLFFLGCANGLAGRAIGASVGRGWLDALIATYDVSVIVLIACGAGLWLTLWRGKQTVTPVDLTVGGVALVLIALPSAGLSWLAVSGLALYVLLFTDSDPPMRQGALILLATTIPMLWSRLLFEFFANFILGIDAFLVGWLLGSEQTGNMVRFANGDGYLVIFPACSSLANMSLAFLCWITVSELAGHRRSLNDVWWCALACACVTAINIGRMSLMGISLGHYEAIHSQIGDFVANALILAVTLGWSILGARRELFSRA
jgi:hypothetical protein